MKTKNTWAIIAIIIVIVIIIGSIFYINAQKALVISPANNLGTNNESSTTAPTNTSSLKTYQNTRYGFSFNYPSSFKLTEIMSYEANNIAEIKIQSLENNASTTPKDYLNIDLACYPTWDLYQGGVDSYGISTTTINQKIDDVPAKIYIYQKEPNNRAAFFATFFTNSTSTVPDYDSCGITMLSASLDTAADLAIISSFNFPHSFDYLKNQVYQNNKVYLTSHK